MNNIRAEMARERMTIQELADILGLSYASTSFRLENQNRFKASELILLSKRFGKTIDYLLGREEE